MPKYIRNITGLSVHAFKRCLDKILKRYPDEPRCSSIGTYQDKFGRTTNSLYDIARNRDVRRVVEVETEVSEEGGLSGWPSSN